MTKSQQNFARLLWALLGITLIIAGFYNSPSVVFSSSLIGWCGGIAFVYAFLVNVNES